MRAAHWSGSLMRRGGVGVAAQQRLLAWARRAAAGPGACQDADEVRPVAHGRCLSCCGPNWKKAACPAFVVRH